ncbi:MAG: hypothetical protein K2I08_07410 [Muribaculaceae bacterium]|nr:hypothetical protein [Muribaculaceae bacterium]MDE6523614.1 hypothetical protein [Muribaculaceae bacterium]
MKKFALLLSSVAVASSAFAASPEVNAKLVSASKASVEPVKMTSRVCRNGAVRSQKLVDAKAPILYKAPNKVEGMSVSYEEPEGLFALGLSEELRGFNGFSYRKGPSFTPLTWYNTSTGATEFEWEVIKDFQTGETEIFNTKDLTHSETFCITDAPLLYGMNANGAAVFQFGAETLSDDEVAEPNVSYFFGGSCMPGDVDFGMSTYLYGQNGGGFTSFPCMSYNKVDTEYFNTSTGLNDIYTDEENGYGMKDPSFVGFANVFKQPAAPYYITKMWSWLYAKATKATVVEMTLYKIDEDGYITDEVLASGEASMLPSSEAADVVLTFELYSLDEDGLQTDEPIVIDCPFIAVMNLNKDDFEEVASVIGGGASAPVSEQIDYPRHALIVISEDGEDQFIPSPYRYYNNDQTMLFTCTDYMWMVDAIFPWSYVIDGIDKVTVPAEGGVASFNISSYYGIQYFDYLLPEDCDWIDMSTATVTVNEELGCQVINLPVAALPEGVTGRYATITAEAPACTYEITVLQGDADAVSVVVTEKNAVYYDLQGRRVANPEKGIYIKKAGNKAEKVLF